MTTPTVTVMTEMRILTVRQPWAWAIIHGGKDVENRVHNLVGDYRGPVAIHAGLDTDTAAGETDLISAAWTDACQRGTAPPYPPKYPGRDRKRSSIYLEYGAIIGVVDLVDVHTADDLEQTKNLRGLWPLCSAWAERTGWHLVLANPRPLTEPIPYRGAQGLRHLPADITEQVLALAGADAPNQQGAEQ